MPDTATIKQLLEAGAHFGHQTGRWNPRMKNYIFTKRNGIHIIDLEKTAAMLDKACIYVRDVVAEGGTILFVGTKKQAQDSIREEATRCGMYYVNLRWLGGMLTNFATIQARIDQLVRLEDQMAKGELARLTKKEVGKIQEKIERLNRQMGGFKEMTALPAALFIVDPTKERIALAEAHRMGIPVVGIVDTNCNPGRDRPSHPRQRRRHPGHPAGLLEDSRRRPRRQGQPGRQRSGRGRRREGGRRGRGHQRQRAACIHTRPGIRRNTCKSPHR